MRLPSQQKVKVNASKLLLKYTYMRLPSQQKKSINVDPSQQLLKYAFCIFFWAKFSQLAKFVFKMAKNVFFWFSSPQVLPFFLSRNIRFLHWVLACSQKM
jgi:hypothetical protein